MDNEIGTVTHYYNRIGVAVIQLTGDMKIGDTILIMGHTTDMQQNVSSMQIDHKNITTASAGMEVAIRVKEQARKGDTVYLVPHLAPQPEQ